MVNGLNRWRIDLTMKSEAAPQAEGHGRVNQPASTERKKHKIHLKLENHQLGVKRTFQGLLTGWTAAQLGGGDWK